MIAGQNVRNQASTIRDYTSFGERCSRHTTRCREYRSVRPCAELRSFWTYMCDSTGEALPLPGALAALISSSPSPFLCLASSQPGQSGGGFSGNRSGSS
jgi:hypothetical protein